MLKMAIDQHSKPARYPLGGMSSVQADKIDRASGVIRDVCVATAGVPVQGHGYEDKSSGDFIQFWTDGETLSSMLACAQLVGEPLKAKLEHETGLLEIIGTYGNWRIADDKLLADFTIAPTCSQNTRDHIFWMAETLPSQFGVSVTAVFARQQVGKSALMRCVELRSADFVDEPAINASLFSKNAGQASPLNSKKSEKTMNEDQLKALKAEIKEEMATETKEAIAEAIKEAVEEVVAASKLAAENKEEEKPEELEEKELSAKSIGVAVAKAVRGEFVALGLSKGASLQGQGNKEAKKEETFSAALSAKKASGIAHHKALMELSKEKPDLVVAELERTGVPSVWML